MKNKYSKSFKKKVVREYLKKSHKSKEYLAKKFGISARSLGRWVEEYSYLDQKDAEELKISFWSLDPSGVVVNFEGDEKDYIKALKEGEFQSVLTMINKNDAVNLKRFVNKTSLIASFGQLSVEDRTVKYEGQTLPDEFVGMILEACENFTDSTESVSVLLKFFDNLLLNPDKDVILHIWPFMQHNDISIDAEGNIVAFKFVRQDGYDCFSNTIFNEVGKTVKEPRALMCSDPSKTCAKGLHVCAQKYLKGFSGGGRKYLKVLVKPEHVVAVPKDYNGSKMRCCQYSILEEVGL